MDTTEHLRRLRRQIDDVFKETISQDSVCKKANYYSSCLVDFSECLADAELNKVLISTASQFESAALFSASGLYRQAMSSLRLALELGLASVYFSANRLELREWQNGTWDLKWGQISDTETGILSNRYARAFFEELSGEATKINEKAKSVYRELSEHVHGNFETWNAEGHTISFNRDSSHKVASSMEAAFEIILFSLALRHAKFMSEQELDRVDFVRDEFAHVEPLRLIFGGPKG